MICNENQEKNTEYEMQHAHFHGRLHAAAIESVCPTYPPWRAWRPQHWVAARASAMGWRLARRRSHCLSLPEIWPLSPRGCQRCVSHPGSHS